jgi:hypothetical protein
MPKDIAIPATGVIDEFNVRVSANFPRDIWVKAAEVRPGNPRVVHHMKANIRPPGSPYMKDAPEGVPYLPPAEPPDPEGVLDTVQQWAARRIDRFFNPPPSPLSATGTDLSGHPRRYNPGVEGRDFDGNAAKFIAADRYRVRVHYTSNSKPQTDRSWLACARRQPPMRRHLTTTAMAPSISRYRPDSRTTKLEPRRLNAGQARVGAAARALSRKDYERGRLPSGMEVRRESSNYRFDWQIGYGWLNARAARRGEATTVSHTTTRGRTGSTPTRPETSGTGAELGRNERHLYRRPHRREGQSIQDVSAIAGDERPSLGRAGLRDFTM